MSDREAKEPMKLRYENGVTSVSIESAVKRSKEILTDALNGKTEPVKVERDHEKFIKIIEEWKGFWMNQTQNSEADRQNYFNRAFGVDANMKYDLAKRIADANPPKPSISEETVGSIRYALSLVIRRHDIDDDVKSSARKAYAELGILRMLALLRGESGE